ncbi:MAG TPA: 16S rRNA (guanine(527)-N(7))-methyltransferase RsmG [Terriglobales bacterium]|nr:16S rRNA (guanine(527)-N(7))-methyltransferase RsmG [Terriglobales bacterium]
MDPARIASLLAPYLVPDSLTDQQLAQVSTYLDLLLKWNARINLTSVRQPEEIVTRHFGESFFAARHLCLSPLVIPSKRDRAEAKERESRDLELSNLIDFGSGAGFPGLPIKLYAPALSVTLIESNQKKATFLREVIRAITLTNIDVFAGRAEDCSQTAGIVTLRAVEKPERALAAAVRLVSPGGHLALFLGADQASATPGLVPGFSWGVPISIPGSSGRVLLVAAIAGWESD